MGYPCYDTTTNICDKDDWMTADKYEYIYAFIATNGRSTHTNGVPTFWLTSKNGRYDVVDFLREGWEPVRETPPTFSVQEVLMNGVTQKQNVGVSLVVLRRPAQYQSDST